MEGQNFFAGLLKGFGTGMLDTERQRQSQHLDGQKQLLDLYLQGIQNEQLDPNLGFQHVAGILQDYLSGGTKGSKNALAALADPENFGQFATGLYTTLGGQKVRTGKVGPTGLPAVGPAPMGGTNAPEMRPQSEATPPSLPSAPDETTPLSPEEEQQFQGWVEANQITDLDHPDSHYDYRGYWKATGGAPHQPGDHYPDTFKQHGHPTFSVESQYSRGPDDGGQWAGDRFMPPLQSLGGRSTMVGPPARLWNTPAEQERRTLEKETTKQVAQTEATYRGKMRVAQQMVADGTAADMDEALTRVGMRPSAAAGAGGELNARALYEQALDTFRMQNNGQQPNPTQKAAMMRKALQDEAEATKRTTAAKTRLTGDLGQRTDQVLAEQNINPLTATPDQMTAASQTAAKALAAERANPWWKSSAQPNEIGMILYEKFGDPTKGDEPRNMMRPGRLTPDQVAEGAKVKQARDAAEQADITAAREKEKMKAAETRLLTPDEASKLQVDYGVTRGEAAELGRRPLTTLQVNAGAASFALERDVTEAELLFEKVWPKVENPEARRVALTLLQRNQDPDFVKLQAALARMPIRQAVMEQGSRPNDTDMLIFKAGMPNTQADNWSLIQVPSSYASGKALLATTRKMVEEARKDIGLLKPDERERANTPTPPTPPPNTGAQRTVPGLTRDANGNWVVTPAR